ASGVLRGAASVEPVATPTPTPTPRTVMDPKALFSLEGRVALVTGGSRGIGRMIAEGLLGQGARVYISARKAEAAETAARELSEFGTCVALPADVSTLDGMEELLSAFRSHEDHLD